MRRRAIALGIALAAGTAGESAEHVWIEGESSADFTFNQHSWYQNEATIRRDLMSPGRPETTDGAWLAHYVPGSPANTAYASYSFSVTEGGTYAFWIRLNPIAAAYRYSLDGGPLFPLDAADFREQLNLVGPRASPAIDIRWLAWVKVADLTFAPASAHTLRVVVAYDASRDASHGGIDCMVLVNHPFEPVGALQPGEVLTPPGADVWFPLLPGDDPFSPASITDMSRLLHRPAGLHGPLVRRGGGFELRDRPGVAVKLWGVNYTGAPPGAALAARQARYFAKHGINLVRFHTLESWLGVLLADPGTGGRVLDAQRLDAFDRWFALLKENGIYLAASAFYPHVVTPADGYPAPLYAELDALGAGRSTSGMATFMRALQDAEWEWLSRLLAHVNPYTGLAYRDDPALAIVETRNEDSIFWHWPLNELANPAGRLPLHRAELQRLWMEWVAARYVTDAALAAAWGAGRRPGDSVTSAAMDVYGAWQMSADGPDWGAGPVAAERARLGDFIRFLAETQRQGYARRLSQLRAAGFGGVYVTTAWFAGGPAAQAANAWTDDEGDAIDRHAYWGGGGTESWRVTRGTVRNETHLETPGRGVAGGLVYDSGGVATGLYQVEDKPVILSEWSSSPPNEWKAEAAPLVAFYGLGLQGWDASVHFAANGVRMGSGWPWNAWSPTFYETLTPHYIGQFPALALAVHEGHVREGDLAAARRITTADLFRGIDPLTRDLPGGGYPASTNLRTPPEVMAIGKVTLAVADGGPPSARTDWTASWDATARTIRATTGELDWDYGNRLVTVKSPRTQGIIGWAEGRRVDLPAALVDVRTPFVTLLLTALDGRPLLDSTHILVTALARDIQLGGLYLPSEQRLLQVGGPPLLLEPVQATIELRGAPIASVRVVDIHGVPTATSLPVAGNAFVIDGRYETYAYEIRRDDACPPLLARSQATSLAPMAPAKTTIFAASPDPNGLTLAAAAPLAEVPYVCRVTLPALDPDPVLAPGANPLVFYQLGGPAAPVVLRLVKDLAASTVEIN